MLISIFLTLLKGFFENEFSGKKFSVWKYLELFLFYTQIFFFFPHNFHLKSVFIQGYPQGYSGGA